MLREASPSFQLSQLDLSKLELHPYRGAQASEGFPEKRASCSLADLHFPPPPNPKYPPPKTMNFMDREVFLQKEHKNLRRP